MITADSPITADSGTATADGYFAGATVINAPLLHANLLQTLLPPISYDVRGPQLNAQLAAEGAMLDAALMAADRVLSAILPDGLPELLIDWERVYGLPDTCLASLESSITLRTQAVIRKIKRGGQLTKQFFITLAAEFGYAITIDEFLEHTVDSSVSAPIFDEEAYYTWRANLPASVPPRDSTVADTVSTPLTIYQTGVLECLFNRLKPAHTRLVFNYF
jgi:uncharacterized protein YmfQ (DUF2313 family)